MGTVTVEKIPYRSGNGETDPAARWWSLGDDELYRSAKAVVDAIDSRQKTRRTLDLV